MSEPDKITLKGQLAEFYGGLELPPALTDELLAVKPRSRRQRSVAVLLSAAAAIVAVAAILLLLDGRAGDRTRLALAEVAQNHLKDIAPEFVSADYAEVQQHLSRLDFSIQPPAGGLVDGYDLVGGRYCKVQGEFAAQLKLRPKQGGPTATAYIVPADGVLAEIGEASAVIDGVRVRCERAGARLVFLAKGERAE